MNPNGRNQQSTSTGTHESFFKPFWRRVEHCLSPSTPSGLEINEMDRTKFLKKGISFKQFPKGRVLLEASRILLLEGCWWHCEGGLPFLYSHPRCPISHAFTRALLDGLNHWLWVPYPQGAYRHPPTWRGSHDMQHVEQLEQQSGNWRHIWIRSTGKETFLRCAVL